MKNFKLASIALLLGLVVMAGCKGTGGDPEPSDVEKQTALLVGTWSTSSATFDNTSRDWANFKLTFTDGGYTSAGHPDGTESNTVWKTTGTWEFAEGDVSKFTRDDGVEVSITTIGENDLTVTFNYDEATNGRVSAITGSWKFVMTK